MTSALHASTVCSHRCSLCPASSVSTSASSTSCGVPNGSTGWRSARTPTLDHGKDLHAID